jgi:hypothetical protein
MTKLSKLPTTNSISSNDFLVAVTNPNTQSQTSKLLVSTLFSNVDTIIVNNLILGNTHIAVSNTETNTKGTIFFSNTHLYIAISNNVLRRIPLETF